MLKIDIFSSSAKLIYGQKIASTADYRSDNKEKYLEKNLSSISMAAETLSKMASCLA